MIPRAASSLEIHYWAQHDEKPQNPVVIGGPEEGPEVIPCPALVCPDAGVVHVAWQLDEIELAALAHGGTLWLTTWGGLPIHLIEVVSRDAAQDSQERG